MGHPERIESAQCGRHVVVCLRWPQRGSAKLILCRSCMPLRLRRDTECRRQSHISGLSAGGSHPLPLPWRHRLQAGGQLFPQRYPAAPHGTGPVGSEPPADSRQRLLLRPGAHVVALHGGRVGSLWIEVIEGDSILSQPAHVSARRCAARRAPRRRCRRRRARGAPSPGTHRRSAPPCGCQDRSPGLRPSPRSWYSPPLRRPRAGC